MSRIVLLSVVTVVFTGCTHGTIGVDAPYSPGDDNPGDDPAVDEPVTDDPGTDDPLGCEDFVTTPHNACGGHEDFSLSVVDVSDADGDGLWSPGEELTVAIDFHSAAEWMNYPGVLGESDAAITGLPAEGDAYWWYGVTAGDSYQVEFVLTLDEAPAAAEVELLFTVGALNCVDNDFEGWECPTPTPMFLDVPVQ